MEKATMLKADKKAIFLLQFAENTLKVIKYLPFSASKGEFLASATETFSPAASDKDLKDLTSRTLQKLGYHHNHLIVSLPRQQVTCRYVKIPAHAPQEIEKIIAFQSPTYLPYPAAELISGYQVIATDKEGYSYVNVVIVHNAVAQRYIDICGTLAAKSCALLLSSYGLCQIFNQCAADTAPCTMAIDVEAAQAEVAIIAKRKLTFSRSFRIGPAQNFTKFLSEEIEKTVSTYRKETGAAIPEQIALLTAKDIDNATIDIVKQQTHLPVKALNYLGKITSSDIFLKQIKDARVSFANLIGLAIADMPASLNLAPMAFKEVQKRAARRKENIRLAAIFLAAFIFFGAGVAKTIDNKQKELAQLKAELQTIAKDATMIEDLEKRISAAATQPYKSASPLTVVYELHQIMPAAVSLTQFDYEEDTRITLRGYTQELNGVVALVAQLEKSEVFKKFSVKVKYATKKRSQTTEGIDFEIACLKEQ
ncbi:MAG: PilN domain-containing protein [Candidatus Omnitrophica bacterium]|nr:PilN domain-containing protein [Candidatus Omnitrophota bacterium]